jgi:hypothetical protein
MNHEAYEGHERKKDKEEEEKSRSRFYPFASLSVPRVRRGSVCNSFKVPAQITLPV